MARKVEQKFKGVIGTITTDNSELFYVSNHICDCIEDRFGKITEDLETKIYQTIETMWLKYDEFNSGILEDSFCRNIEETNNFEDLKFDYLGSDWKIEPLNDYIKKFGKELLVK